MAESFNSSAGGVNFKGPVISKPGPKRSKIDRPGPKRSKMVGTPENSDISDISEMGIIKEEQTNNAAVNLPSNQDIVELPKIQEYYSEDGAPEEQLQLHDEFNSTSLEFPGGEEPPADENGLKECHLCHKKVKLLKSHIEDMHFPVPMPCPYCGKMFGSRNKMHSHKSRGCRAKPLKGMPIGVLPLPPMSEEYDIPIAPQLIPKEENEHQLLIQD